ncbi:MAG: tRNA epoxyqueuosine(34) reductase QueG [Planctomycetia bacterium]|nr:tRNA epoxyqueuosine(34) reductase QueG [Planctomycetia bacterium]
MTALTTTSADLAAAIKQESRRLGFSFCGICPAVAPTGLAYFREWLDCGFAGEMRYLPDRAAAYEHPQHVLDGTRSLIVLAMDYHQTAEPALAGPGQGRVSRYAWGGDYHDLIHERLRRLADWLAAQRPGAVVRGVVDTAPLLEREFAQLAGLGWIGKNTMLISKSRGSWFFLAVLLTDLELDYDAPHDADHCGTCTACLDACPTSAFVAPGVLDGRRCISYLTIELKGPIPRGLRPGIGNWLFGCDVCQDVCPWNGKAAASDEASFHPRDGMNPVDLAALFELDDAAFRARFRDTPLWRARRRGLLRNAAIVLGNNPTPSALPALLHGLADLEPLVRGACAWALGRYEQPEARLALQARRLVERDANVLAEIEPAITAVDITWQVE